MFTQLDVMHFLNTRTRAYELIQYHLQDLSLRTGLNLSKPTFVCIKLTMRCNARCRHCDIYKPEYTELELPTETWFTVLRRLRDWLGAGAPLTFTGGEIFLRTDVLEILEEARRLDLSLYLLSNGWLLNEKRVERMMALDPRVVQVSLDGIRTETHDFLRGLRGFGERARNALALAVGSKRRLGVATEVMVACVVFKQNLAELAELTRWAAQAGVDAIKFQPIEQTYMEEHDPEWFRTSPLWVDDIEAAEHAIDELIALKRQGMPIHNSVESLEVMKRYFEDPLGLQRKIVSHDQHWRSRDCRSAVGDFDISSNGDVRLCYRMEPIGNVGTQDPRGIWNRRPRCWTEPCAFMGDCAD